jgi:hypothetical protein
MYTSFLRIFKKKQFLEIEKGVHSKGPILAQGFSFAAVAACHGQRAKRPREAGRGGLVRLPHSPGRPGFTGAV